MRTPNTWQFRASFDASQRAVVLPNGLCSASLKL